MLVKNFKFEKTRYGWFAESKTERPTRGTLVFCTEGKTLAGVMKFAALVRNAERTGMLNRLAELIPSWPESRDYGCCWAGEMDIPAKSLWLQEEFLARQVKNGK